VSFSISVMRDAKIGGKGNYLLYVLIVACI